VQLRSSEISFFSLQNIHFPTLTAAAFGRNSIDFILLSRRRGAGRHIVQFSVVARRDTAHAQNQPAGSWTPVSARINDLIKRYGEITSSRLHRHGTS